MVGKDTAVSLEVQLVPGGLGEEESGYVLEREAAVFQVVEGRGCGRGGDFDVVAFGPAHDAGIAVPGRALAERVDRLLEERRERGVVATVDDRRGRFEGRANAGLGIEGDPAQLHVLPARPTDQRPGGGELLGRRPLRGTVTGAVGDQDPGPNWDAEPVGPADDLQPVAAVRLAGRHRSEVALVAE